MHMAPCVLHGTGHHLFILLWNGLRLFNYSIASLLAVMGCMVFNWHQGLSVPVNFAHHPCDSSPWKLGCLSLSRAGPKQCTLKYRSAFKKASCQVISSQIMTKI